MQYITRNELSQLKGENLTIKAIYGPKREGLNRKTNKMELFVTQDGNWKMRVWDPAKKSFNLIDGNVDYSIHKKKYDVTFTIPEDKVIKVAKYNKEEKKDEYFDEKDSEFSVKSLSATVVGDMLAAGIAFGKVPETSDGYREYDWEEAFLKEAVGMVTTFDTKKAKYDINGKTGTYFEFTFKDPNPRADVAKSEAVEEDENTDYPF